MSYTIIYDGTCNLCSNLVQFLETIDRGQRFVYVPMQDEQALVQWQITAADCQLGMIVINNQQPQQRWQGSAAVETIARQLPVGDLVMAAYRGIPGLKYWGDKGYEQVRDHRYDWFGRRSQVYQSNYPAPMDCAENTCSTATFAPPAPESLSSVPPECPTPS
ncbi:MAG: DCC1-like thiol-disulfide oxidoreductase family protein [Cyanobacteriota bacterium]|nr:DCC1-like thiol-disulfide oxidoreductase family protein [Cyanobacteriota bacterium]